MRKKLVIVFFGLLCFLGFLAGCGEKNEVLAVGMKTLPNTLTYTVGDPIDVKGGQVAVVFSEAPEEVQVYDLKEEMLDKASYDVYLTGVKNVKVIYTFEGKEYYTEFRVEYFERPFKEEAIEKINAFNSSVSYGKEEAELVALYKSLAIANVKLSNNAQEAESVVNNLMVKVSNIPTKAEQDKVSAALLKSQEAAKAVVNSYKKDAAVAGQYAQIIALSKSIAIAEIGFATTAAEINLAVELCKASVDNAILGNKTLDQINEAKIAAEAAKKLAEEAKKAADDAADLSGNKAAASEAAKLAAQAAQAKAEAAKAQAETAKTAAEAAQAKAETAKAAAEAAKAQAEQIKNDVNATKAEVDAAKAKAEAAKAAAETAKAQAETAKAAAETAKAEATQAELGAKEAKLAAEAAKAAAEAAKALAETAALNAANSANAAEVAKDAAEAAKLATEDLYEQVKDLIETLPQAAPAIDEVNNYVANADYAGLELVLVQTIKAAYVASITSARTEPAIDALVVEAKALLDSVNTALDNSILSQSELVAAKAQAQSLFINYVIDVAEYNKSEVEEYLNNGGFDYSEGQEDAAAEALYAEVQKLIDEVNEKIADANNQAEIDGALAYGQSKARLETIYVDYYASYIVRWLNQYFRDTKEVQKDNFSNVNWNEALRIKDYYQTLITRLDKFDQLIDKAEEYKEKLDAIRTKAEEVYDLVYSVETPIIVEVPQRADQPNKDSYNGTECSGASLAEIVAKLSAADLDVPYSLNPTGTNTTIEAQLRAFETESGQIVDVLATFEKYIDRYNVSLAAAKANAATGVIALIDDLPQYGANNATATLTLDAGQEENAQVKAAREAYELWLDTYFDSIGYPAADEPLNVAIVYNIADLEKAEARVQQLVDAKNAAEVATDGVIDLIKNTATVPGYVVLDSETAIVKAREEFDAWELLYEIDQINRDLIVVVDYSASPVTPLYAKLVADEARLAELKLAKVAAEAIDAKVDAVLADGEYITLDAQYNDNAEITAAETDLTAWLAEYFDTTDYATAYAAEPINVEMVTKYADLVEYRERYTVLENAKADAETAVTGVIALIAALPAVDEVALLDALKNPTTHEADTDAARVAYEAWIQTYFVADGYVAADEPLNTAIVNNYRKLVDVEYRIEELNEAKVAAQYVDTLMELTTSPYGYVALNNADEIEDAREAYTNWVALYNINGINENLVNNLDKLEASEVRLAKLQEAAIDVADVVDLINAIVDDGDYIKISDDAAIDSLAAILAAEAAKAAWVQTYFTDEGFDYNAEPENAKIISNNAKLETYRARYNKLVEAKAAAEDPTTGVIALVDAIATTVTLAEYDNIYAARKAYNNWIKTYFTDQGYTAANEPINISMSGLDVKALTLLNAETRYAELDALLKELANSIDNATTLVTEITSASDITAIEAVEAAIEDAEAKFVNLRTENTEDPKLFVKRYDDLIAARKSLEHILFDKAYDAAELSISNLRDELVAQMGINRVADTTAVQVKAAQGIALIHAVVEPTDTTPELGADNDYDRATYTNEMNTIEANTLKALYVAAKYLVSGDDVNGYDVVVYAPGLYKKFVPTTGDAITTVKDLTVDALVGNGHVEFEGITVTGTVTVLGGGSNSVVFLKSNLNNIVVDKKDVKVSFDAETTVAGEVVLGLNVLTETDKVIVETNNNNLNLIVNCSVEIKGTKTTAELNLQVNKSVEITTALKDVKVEAEEGVEYAFNGTTVKEDVAVDENGEFVFPVGEIAKSDICEGTKELAYVVDGATVSFGGEGSTIAWSLAAAETGAAGYKYAVVFYAPKSLSETAKPELTTEAPILASGYAKDDKGVYVVVVFKAVQEGSEYQVSVKWAANAAATVYTVKFEAGTTFDLSAGTLSEDEAKVAGEKAVATVEEAVITFSGVLKLYAENELGEGYKAGYYVGYKIVPDKLANAEPVTGIIEVTTEVLLNGATVEQVWGNKEFYYEIEFAKDIKLEGYAPETVTINTKLNYAEIEKEVKFEATTAPSYAEEAVVWSVSDETLATITEDGTLLPLKGGYVTVYAKSKFNEEVVASYSVTILADVASVIASLPDNGSKVNVGVKGVVVALQNGGYYVSDGTAAILVYDSNSAKVLKVNDYVAIVGQGFLYSKDNKYCPEITSIKYYKLEDAPVVEYKAEEFDLGDATKLNMTTLQAAKDSKLYGKYIKITGTLNGSGYYWNVTDEVGNIFYISNSYGSITSGLVAGCQAELEVVVRDVNFKATSNNKANTLGGALVNINAIFAKDILVDSAYEGGNVVINGLTYVEGKTIFSSLAAAVAAVPEGSTINVLAGTYAEAFTITTSNLTILGPNAKLAGNAEGRVDEAVISKKITIEAGVKNITIKGFKFTAHGAFLAKNGVDGVEVSNNVIETYATNAFFDAQTYEVSNIKLNYNYSSLFQPYRFGRFTNVTNVETVGNDFTGNQTYFFDFINTAGWMAGELVVTDNRVLNSAQSFLYSKGVKNINAEIKNNYLENIASTAIDFRDMKDAEAKAVFNIELNTFNNAGCGWCPIRIRTAGYTATNELTINVVNNKFIDSAWTDGTVVNFMENPSLSSAAEGFKQIYTVGKNYYEMNGVVVTELTDNHFTGAAISYEAPYASLEEYEEGIAPKPVVGTLSFANKAQRTSYSTTKQVWTQNGVTLTNNKDKSTANVGDYANPARLYASSQVIITVEGEGIAKVVFNANSNSYATALVNSLKAAGYTYTVSGKVVTLTFDKAVDEVKFNCSAQVRLNSIEVTYYE